MGTGANVVESYWTGGNLRFVEAISGNNKQVQFECDVVFVGGTTTNLITFDTSGATFTMAGVTLASAGLTSTSNLAFSANSAKIRGPASQSTGVVDYTLALQGSNSATAYEDVIEVMSSTGGGTRLRFFNSTAVGSTQLGNVAKATSLNTGFIDRINAITTGLIAMGLIATS